MEDELGEVGEVKELGGDDVGAARRGWKKNTDYVLCYWRSNEDDSPSIKLRPSLRKRCKPRGRCLPTPPAPHALTCMSKCARLERWLQNNRKKNPNKAEKQLRNKAKKKKKQHLLQLQSNFQSRKNGQDIGDGRDCNFCKTSSRKFP